MSDDLKQLKPKLLRWVVLDSWNKEVVLNCSWLVSIYYTTVDNEYHGNKMYYQKAKR